MIKRNKYHFLFLLMLMLTLSSCDTTQITEDEDGFSDDTFLSDSELYDTESTNEKSGTFVESYSEQGVLCGSDIVDFPDQSFVAKFRVVITILR